MFKYQVTPKPGIFDFKILFAIPPIHTLSILNKFSNIWSHFASISHRINGQKFSINRRLIIISRIRLMSQERNIAYNPRPCAFHPKELIFNFCRNPECLLPLCPSCVKVHSAQHKSETTFGQFENMEKMVDGIDNFLLDMTKELDDCCEDIRESDECRNRENKEVKRRMQQARAKMLNLVERFFTDFEKEVTKSMGAYNCSMKENYDKVEMEINGMKQDLQTRTNNLQNDKVLKTVIGFYSKLEEEKFKDGILGIREKLNELQEQKVTVVCQQTSTQRIVDELGNYIHLEFLNWENEIKYVAQFVKTGFSERAGSQFGGTYNKAVDQTH